MALASAPASPRLICAVEMLELEGHERVLEVGCGHGVAVSLICDRLTTGVVTAIDRSAKMIDQARRRNSEAEQSGRATFVQSTIADATLADGSFDVALAVHVPVLQRGNPVRELELLRRWLRPGGRLIIAGQPLQTAEIPPTTGRLVDLLESRGFAANVRFHDLADGRMFGVVGTTPA